MDMYPPDPILPIPDNYNVMRLMYIANHMYHEGQSYSHTPKALHCMLQDRILTIPLMTKSSKSTQNIMPVVSPVPLLISLKPAVMVNATTSSMVPYLPPSSHVSVIISAISENQDVVYTECVMIVILGTPKSRQNVHIKLVHNYPLKVTDWVK